MPCPLIVNLNEIATSIKSVRREMEEENGVQVEETTEVSQPEVNTEEVEAPTEETQVESSEVTENTAEAEPETPKTSRATERIRELIAQKKELEAQNRALKAQSEPQLDGVDETGIDPNRFAESVLKQAEARADQKYSYNRQIDEATQKFPIVAENELVGTRATALMQEGYSPVQAAEIASLEWQDATEKEISRSTQRKQAGANLRAEASIQSAGKAVKTDSGNFTRAEIINMSPADYTKNASAIQAQLEKYGPDSFNE